MLRKVLFSCFQVLLFTYEIARGQAKLSPEIVEVDWSHSPRRRKFVIIGCLKLTEEQIRIKTGTTLSTISDCPQKKFFADLNAGIQLEDTDYAKLVRSLNYGVDYDKWFEDKLLLWKTFDPEAREVLPIAVRRGRGDFIVEDGAHRLALLSLKGDKTFRVGVSIWFVG
jgi:hypothetical protein